MAEETGARRVVIVGGGFAGLLAVRALSRAPVQVTLLDRLRREDPEAGWTRESS